VDRLIDEMPTILDAFWLTIRLAAFSIVGSLVLGTILAIFRVSPVPILRGFGTVVVNVVRNTPLTLIMLFCVFGLNYQLGLTFSESSIDRNNFWLAFLALSVYTATFVCEVLRSGINTVDKGQVEAARAVGLTFLQNLRLIVLPQAARAVIAPMGSVLIALTKNTTVAVAIGLSANLVYEAGGQMKALMEKYGDLVPQIFLVFAVGFLCLTLPMGFATTWAAKRFGVVR
jgi:glutamate transport system permease protein